MVGKISEAKMNLIGPSENAKNATKGTHQYDQHGVGTAIKARTDASQTSDGTDGAELQQFTAADLVHKGHRDGRENHITKTDHGHAAQGTVRLQAGASSIEVP